eukprot:7235447-Alexandrium_andersonii.AAC.1
MSASLVGSEMCIRDRPTGAPRCAGAPWPSRVRYRGAHRCQAALAPSPARLHRARLHLKPAWARGVARVRQPPQPAHH